MTKKEARDLLIRTNEWRRYNGPVSHEPQMPNPKAVGRAIDIAIEVLTKELETT